jgi:hypothetical protein
MLTANEARIASGRLPRDQLLDRFAPFGQGAREPVLREQVSLLLATDLLSEGVNLQDASIVVHFDLPWNPTRLSQRLGRVRRPGGAPLVQSWLMAPPATTELLLRVEARLRAKLARAERTIGRTLPVMPVLAPSSDTTTLGCSEGVRDDADIQASAEALGAIADRVTSWGRTGLPPHALRGAEPLAAAVECDAVGWLAALSDGRLLARIGSSPPNTASSVASAVELACRMGRACREAERSLALADATAWLERERLALACGMGDDASTLDVALERRIAGVLARAPRHARAFRLDLAARLRARLGRSRPLGAERELEQLIAMHVAQAADDTEWLTSSLGVIAREPARQMEAEPTRVVALIVLGPRPEA